MKTYFKSVLSLILVVVSLSPVSVSAATSAGVTPGSFWYFLDTASEKIALLFTFNPENKVKKALEYADERLAEVEVIVGDKNPTAVKAAIADYEGNVALATEKSKEVKDKAQAESLFTSIETNASKNQEVLSAVLIRVPDEAKAAITQAIEASKKGQEEAARQIVELKGEVEKLKQGVAELKQAKDTDQSSEVEKLKREVEELRAENEQREKATIKSAAVAPKALDVAPSVIKPAPLSPEKTSRITTLPNGAVVEIDANGNILRYIKDAEVTTDSVEEQRRIEEARREAEEKKRIEEENKRIEAQIRITEQCVQDKKAIVVEYNTKKLDLERQINDRKSKYYSDYQSDIDNCRGRCSTGTLQMRLDALLREANREIDLLNLELDKLYVEYSAKLNQLQC